MPEARHRVSLQLGIAYPNGEYNSSSFEDDYPAFAREGLLLTGEYRYSLHKHWAAGVSVAYRNNGYDLDALVQSADELVTAKDSEAWRSVFTLATLYYTLPLGSAELYAKGAAGASFNRSASWQVSTTYGNIRMPEDKATALALGWAAGFNVPIRPLIVGFEAGILYTRPTFTVQDAQGNPFRHRQPMHSFNTSVGLSYAF